MVIEKYNKNELLKNQIVMCEFVYTSMNAQGKKEREVERERERDLGENEDALIIPNVLFKFLLSGQHHV